MEHFGLLQSLIQSFLNVNDNVKYYHWQTTSYARHKATCKFLTTFSTLTDQFVETYLGHFQECKTYLARSKSLSLNVDPAIENFNNLKSDSIALMLEKLCSDLKSLETTLPTDLLNIRDEIVGLCKQTLYLFSFK
jgi:hypothetical protein